MSCLLTRGAGNAGVENEGVGSGVENAEAVSYGKLLEEKTIRYE